MTERSSVTVIPPEKLKQVGSNLTLDERKQLNANAATLRQEIHAKGFEEGVKHAGKLAEQYRAYIYAFLGLLVGAGIAGFFAISVYERGTYTGGALIDRTLSRTVEQPAPPALPLHIRSPDDLPDIVPQDGGIAGHGVAPASRPRP